MSFSGDVKTEISRRIPENRCCVIAEACAIIRFAGEVDMRRGQQCIKVVTGNVKLARRFLQLIKEAFDIQVNLEIERTPTGRNNIYTIQISDDETVDIVFGEIAPALQGLKSSQCCARAFIRSAFLAAGSMSDPSKSYHLEFVCRAESAAVHMQEIAGVFGVNPKIAQRKNKYVVYIKDSSEIVDALNIMGAHKSLMELENIRIIKEMKNSANRQFNCDSANINKMVKAATEQIENIRLIAEYMGLDSLSPQLKQMAEVRLAHPEDPLKDLGNYLEPPVGKSGVNHRLKKLESIAEDIKKRNGLDPMTH